MPNHWWSNINELALIEAMRLRAREQDGGFKGEARSRMNSGLIGIARQLGLSDEEIQSAIESERMLTIYEP